jgi:hypothetical protein
MARELLQMADSAESEAVKLNAIRDALDRAGLGAKSEVTVELRPWERLLQDVSGVANISRAEHLAHKGAILIDAEVVEPQPQPQPIDDGSPQPPPTPTPTHDGPTPPPYMAEPGEALVNMDEAVIMDDQHRIARGKRW